MLTLYGIPNCNTVKGIKENNVAYEFHIIIKKDGLVKKIENGWPNNRGKSW
jgi:arsenate reductase-like glutaredoxin family protein